MRAGFVRIVGRGVSTRLPSFSFINCLTVFLAVLLLARIHYLYSSIDVPPRGLDETYWMQGAYFYHLFFLKRDFFNEDWYNPISYDHPPVGRYILGFALHASNHKVVDTNGGAMYWMKDVTSKIFMPPLSRLVDKYNYSSDRRLLDFCHSSLNQLEPAEPVPLNPEDYMVGRKTAFIFAFLTATLLVVISAYALKSYLTGMMAGIFFLNNKVSMSTFQQALPDPICCFFVLLALLTLFPLFRELGLKWGSKKKLIILSVLEGLFLSLALGTKFITTYMAVTVVVVFMTSILLDVINSRKTGGGFPMRRVASKVSVLTLISASAVTFFVLLNPFLYPDPIGNTLKLINYRLTCMEIQSRVQTHPINSFSKRIGTIYRKGILRGHWFHRLHEKILYIFTLITGAGFLTKKSLDELSAGSIGAHTIVFLWMSTTFITNGLMINMTWARYYVPFIMCTALTLALGTETIINSLKSMGERLSRKPTRF
jgi:hypothetical protein